VKKHKDNSALNQQDNLNNFIKKRKTLNSSLPDSSFLNSKYSLNSKIKKKSKLERLIKDLKKNGIKFNVKESESFDEELFKNLLNIKKLVTLKNKKYSGGCLEIIKTGKDIILQVGGDRSKSPIQLSKGIKENINSNLETLKNSNRSKNTNANLSNNVTMENSLKKVHTKKKNKNINDEKKRLKLSGVKKDKMTKKKDISLKESARKKKIKNDWKKESKRKCKRNVKTPLRKTHKRIERKALKAEKSKNSNKISCAVNVTKKVRNSYANTKDSSFNYLDLYQGSTINYANKKERAVRIQDTKKREKIF
jgi:hypothetical protein